MYTRKTWREKLERAQEARVVPMPEKMQRRLGQGTLLIPRPLDVDALIRTVPEGRLITIGEIRSVLAGRAGASTTCPLVTGIFIRLSAEAAAEDERAGKTRVTPYWRVVRDDGSFIEKLPGGPREQARRLIEEGHEVSARGRKRRVVLVRASGSLPVSVLPRESHHARRHADHGRASELGQVRN